VRFVYTCSGVLGRCTSGTDVLRRGPAAGRDPGGRPRAGAPRQPALPGGAACCRGARARCWRAGRRGERAAARLSVIPAPEGRRLARPSLRLSVVSCVIRPGHYGAPWSLQTGQGSSVARLQVHAVRDGQSTGAGIAHRVRRTGGLRSMRSGRAAGALRCALSRARPVYIRTCAAILHRSKYPRACRRRRARRPRATAAARRCARPRCARCGAWSALPAATAARSPLCCPAWPAACCARCWRQARPLGRPARDCALPAAPACAVPTLAAAHRVHGCTAKILPSETCVHHARCA